MFLRLLLAGVVGGVLGAMGLGGGTLLMPILSFCFDISPRLAAWLNLVSFLPAATVAVILHSRDGLIVWREVIYLLSFALVGAILAYVFGKGMSDQSIKRAFGWLLVSLGSLSIILLLFGFRKGKGEPF